MLHEFGLRLLRDSFRAGEVAAIARSEKHDAYVCAIVGGISG